jgi:hypothetical protein
MRLSLAEVREIEQRIQRHSGITPTPQKHKHHKPQITLGHWVELDFFLPVALPSFKNSKQLFVYQSGQKAGKPGLITKPEYRQSMDQAIGYLQIKKLTKYPLTNIRYHFRFRTNQLKQDSDGCEAAALDCLRDAGVIQDDSRHHIIAGSHDWELAGTQQEGVTIQLRGQEYCAT